MNIRNLLDCLDYAQNDMHLRLAGLINLRTFFSVCRKLSGTALKESEKELLKKFIHGVHNKNPACARRGSTNWDVQILLDYFNNLPNNQQLSLQQLGGKLTLLLLICSMCRIGEVRQLSLSNMDISDDDNTVTFHLSEPTKTYTFDNRLQKGLQRLIFRRIPGHPEICPVTTLIDYIDRTRGVRVNHDKLFTISNGNPARRLTICRWAKNHLKVCGLGDRRLHSTRGSAGSACLISGMNLSELSSKIGWLSVDTFIVDYMKPIVPPDPVAETTTNDDIGMNIPDGGKSPTTPKNLRMTMVDYWKSLPDRISTSKSRRFSRASDFARHYSSKKRIQGIQGLVQKYKGKRLVPGSTTASASKKTKQVTKQIKREKYRVMTEPISPAIQINDCQVRC